MYMYVLTLNLTTYLGYVIYSIYNLYNCNYNSKPANFSHIAEKAITFLHYHYYTRVVIMTKHYFIMTPSCL